jgi:hypothetical protein
VPVKISATWNESWLRKRWTLRAGAGDGGQHPRQLVHPGVSDDVLATCTSAALLDRARDGGLLSAHRAARFEDAGWSKIERIDGGSRCREIRQSTS